MGDLVKLFVCQYNFQPTEHKCRLALWLGCLIVAVSLQSCALCFAALVRGPSDNLAHQERGKQAAKLDTIYSTGADIR